MYISLGKAHNVDCKSIAVSALSSLACCSTCHTFLNMPQPSLQMPEHACESLHTPALHFSNLQSRGTGYSGSTGLFSDPGAAEGMKKVLDKE